MTNLLAGVGNSSPAMKIICNLIAGSRLYGLETPESDYDYRGIFINTDYKKIIGLKREKLDQFSNNLFFELTHYLNIFIKTSNPYLFTQVVEILFANSFNIKTKEFEYIQDNKYKIIDSKIFFDNIIKYIRNEKKIANEKFNPKNFYHLIRICFCGKHFFQTSYYPINLLNCEIRDLLFSIKTQPENYNKNQLNELVEQGEKEFIASYHNRKENYKFDFEFASQMCLRFYSTYLTF